MHTIVLTRQNVVPNTNNSRLVYNLPGSVNTEGSEIALGAAYLYYSWENVNSSPLQNNVFTFTMPKLGNDSTGAPLPTGIGEITYTVTIPNGQYEITDIQAFLEQFCIINNLYLIETSTGKNVYFLQIQTNPTQYAIQVNLFALPTSLPAGYTEPAAGFNVNAFSGATVGSYAFASSQVPGISFPAKFDELVGAPMKATGATYAQNPSSDFPVGTAGAAFPNGTVSLLSTVTPNVNPNSVVFINCNLVQNKYANPQTFLYPIAAKGDIGALISVEPPEYAYNKMIVGQVSNLIIDLTTAEGRPINIQDPNMVIILIIRDQTTHHANLGASTTFGVSSSSHTQSLDRHITANQAVGGPTAHGHAGRRMNSFPNVSR